MSESADTVWYVYAVVRADAYAPRCGQAILDHAGLTMIAAASYQLAALVSPVPRALFAATDSEARMNDPDWVAARAAAHHAVVCEAAAAGPCLPLGFGTLFTTRKAVCDWLAAHAASLQGTLADLAGRREWSIFLTENADIHANWLALNDAHLAALREATEAASPGTAFLMARRLARAVQTARTTHGNNVAASIAAALAALPCDYRADSPRAGGIASWHVLAETAFSLQAAIDVLAKPLQGTGLTLSAAGPFPPYIFARAVFARAPWALPQNAA